MKNKFQFLPIILLSSFLFIGATGTQQVKFDVTGNKKATINIKNLSTCEIANIEFFLAVPYTSNGILYESFGLSDDIIRAKETFGLWRNRNTAVKSYTYTCYCNGQKSKFKKVEKYFSVRIGESKTVEISCD